MSDSEVSLSSNAERAQRAWEVLRIYRAKDPDNEVYTSLYDLIADLMHLADTESAECYGGENAVNTALEHYLTEVEMEYQEEDE